MTLLRCDPPWSSTPRASQEGGFAPPLGDHPWKLPLPQEALQSRTLVGPRSWWLHSHLVHFSALWATQGFGFLRAEGQSGELPFLKKKKKKMETFKTFRRAWNTTTPMSSPPTSHKYDCFIIFVSALKKKKNYRQLKSLSTILFPSFPRENYLLLGKSVSCNVRFNSLAAYLYNDSEGNSVLWAYLFCFGNVANETGRVESLSADLAWAWAALCLTPPLPCSHVPGCWQRNGWAI